MSETSPAPQGTAGHSHCDDGHDHDHGHHRGGPLAAAEDACRSRGVKLTPVRRQVLAILHGTSKPLGAYEVAAALGAAEGKLVAPVTVYRALDFLMAQGFVHRLESRNAFVACPHRHDEGDLAIFLICETCGHVDEAPSASVRTVLDGVARNAGFTPRSRVIEIAGTCGRCRAA